MREAKHKIGCKGKKKGDFKELSSIIVFSVNGEFLRVIGTVSSKDKPRRRYCGVSVDR